MTYLRALRLISAVLRWLMRRADTNGAAWATLADWDGHIAFREIDYVKRVRQAGPQPVVMTQASGWVTTAPTTSAAGTTTVTARWMQSP